MCQTYPGSQLEIGRRHVKRLLAVSVFAGNRARRSFTPTPLPLRLSAKRQRRARQYVVVTRPDGQVRTPPNSGGGVSAPVG